MMELPFLSGLLNVVIHPTSEISSPPMLWITVDELLYILGGEHTKQKSERSTLDSRSLNNAISFMCHGYRLLSGLFSL